MYILNYFHVHIICIYVMYIFAAQSTAMINLNTSYGTLSCDKVPEGVGILG